MLSHSLGCTHTLHAEEVHQEPNEVVSASPQQGENTGVPRDLEVTWYLHRRYSRAYMVWYPGGLHLYYSLWIVPLVVLKLTTCAIQGVVYHRLIVVY
jgi:hypothetical protein